MSEYAAAIELGTTKLVVLVVSLEGEDLRVIGLGKAPYFGMNGYKSDAISNLRHAVESAINQAQTMAGVIIPRVVLGVPGQYSGLVQNSGKVEIQRDRVSISDIEEVLSGSSAYRLPQEWKVIETIPHYYQVDNGQPLKDPLRQPGSYLEVLSSLICAENAFIEEVSNVLSDLRIQVDKVKSVPMACGDVLLTIDEKTNGVLFLDIGGRNTDFIFYKDGVPVYMDCLPVGGWNISNDLCIGLNIPFDEAEKLKRHCVLGLDLTRELKENEMHIPIRIGAKTQMLPLVDVQQIVEARIEEIFQLVKDKLEQNCNFYSSEYDVVLTGGGVSLIRGSRDFASQILQRPVRLGVPDVIGASNPALSSVYSLLAQRDLLQDYSAYQSNTLLRKLKTIKEYCINFFKK